MTGATSFVRRHGQRIAWFGLDANARSYALSSLGRDAKMLSDSKSLAYALDAAVQERKFIALVSNIVHLSVDAQPVGAKDERGNDTVTKTVFGVRMMNSIEPCLTLSFEYREAVRKIFVMLRRASLSDIANTIALWIREVGYNLEDRSHTSFFFDPFNSSKHRDWSADKYRRDPAERLIMFLRLLNECIILIDAIDDASEDMDQQLREYFVSKFDRIFRRISSDWNMTPLSSFSALRRNVSPGGTSFEASLNAEPRRCVAAAITNRSNTVTSSVAGYELEDAAKVFDIMDCRIIETSEWFMRFSTLVSEASYSCQGIVLLQRFAFAVYQLVHCGLVVRSRRREDAFEKVAMVWCSK